MTTRYGNNGPILSTAALTASAPIAYTTDGTATLVPFDQSIAQGDVWVPPPPAAPDRLIAPRPGIYLVSGTVTMAAPVDTDLRITITADGTPVATVRGAPSAAGNSQASVSAVVPGDAGTEYRLLISAEDAAPAASSYAPLLSVVALQTG